MKTKIRPLHDRLLVRREDHKTASGIVIPDSVKEKPDQGEVVAVGNGRIQDDGSVHPLDVKKGDRILFGKYSGTSVNIDSEELLVIRESDVLVIIG